MSFIKNWLRDELLELNSYQVPASNNMLKLDAMESPFALSEELQQQLASKLKNAEINRYPQNHKNLHKIVKELMQIPDDLEIMLGNGSDELLQLLMLGTAKDSKIMGFEPSFVMYKMLATWCNLEYFGVNLDDNFEIDINLTLERIAKDQPKIIFIAYPNNPTGNNFSRQSIEKIIKISTGLVVVDEAYYAYSDDSFIKDIDKFENLLVIRTISKIGFAGLRLGMMIGTAEMIAEFDKLRMPYNINSLTMISAEFLLQQKEMIAKNAQIIIQQRELIFAKLQQFKQITAFKSSANFILFKAENFQALFEFLLKNNILIKNMGQAMPNFGRLTISSADENAQFLECLAKFYE